MEFRLIVVRVFVRDWERAIRFYTETLGIPLASRQDALGWAALSVLAPLRDPDGNIVTLVGPAAAT